MGKIKPYKEQDSSKQTAQEPMMATYHQSAIPMDDFINSIPRDALAEALLFALEENKAGHCISNSQIESMINIIRKSKCSRVSKRKVHFTKRSV